MERRPPPFSARAWLRYDALRAYLDRIPAGADILEVGPGVGALACRLAERFKYTGVESDGRSAARAADRLGSKGRIVHGTVDNLDANASFFAVLAFEVLEHIDDDVGALTQRTSRLSSGGIMLISVPAFMRRFGASDERVGHFRRYERDELSAKLDGSGLRDIEITTYGFPLEYVLEPVRNLAARSRPMPGTSELRTASSGRFYQPRAGFGWLTRTITSPFAAAQKPFARSRFGTGFIAFARRR